MNQDVLEIELTPIVLRRVTTQVFMIRDKTITNGGVVVTTTSLFWRVFLKSRGYSLVEEVPLENQTPLNGAHFTELNDLIGLVNNLKNGWSRLHSVRIIKQLEQKQKEITGEIEDLNRVTESELWLLQALALEKSLLEDNYAVEKLYRKCLSGKFQVVLILNNLGVLQARMQRCREALALFKDAMFYANAFPKRIVRAPFNKFRSSYSPPLSTAICVSTRIPCAFN